MKYLVNMDIWRIYSCLRRFALVQFQYVRHAILALFRHNGTRVYENCCVNMLCDGYSTHRFKLKLQM